MVEPLNTKLPLDDLICSLDGMEFGQPGFEYRKGWNAAIMHCMDLQRALAYPQPLPEATEEARFLIERLDDFERGSLSDSIEDACRDFDGHVSPAIERLRAALEAFVKGE